MKRLGCCASWMLLLYPFNAQCVDHEEFEQF